MADDKTDFAHALMAAFAERTGLTSARSPKRYLWTDAFAVCNFIALARATKDDRHAELAERLVDEAHRVLGSYAPDDLRSGWLSGLPDDEAAAHPTRGGLRIGKPQLERAPYEASSEPRGSFDDAEWDRDGQYFHYLTKWMHALSQMARFTREARYQLWASELAAAAHSAFAYGPTTRRRMVWKLSVDLSRPLVPSMGHHDPLDGLVTVLELEATAAALDLPPRPDLRAAAEDFAAMVDPDPHHLATDDSLGIGGLLFDACRIVQLDPRHRLLAPLVAASASSLRHFAAGAELDRPASRRLAFRELGLAIGLAAATPLGLAPHAPLRDRIESFWSDPANRRTATWAEHADIDEVMLATSLLPDGFLVLAPVRAQTPNG